MKPFFWLKTGIKPYVYSFQLGFLALATPSGTRTHILMVIFFIGLSGLLYPLR